MLDASYMYVCAYVAYVINLTVS